MKKYRLLICFVFLLTLMVGCQGLNSTNETTLQNQTTVQMTSDYQTTEFDTLTIEPISTSETEITTLIDTTEADSTTEAPTTTEAPITTVVMTTPEPTTTPEPMTTPEPTTTEAQTTQVPTTTESQAFVPTGYNLLQDELDYVGIPSMGDVKVLVFAIDFPDQLVTANDPTLAEIDLAFNGQSDQLSFESVNSYYLKSSYQKLNLTADVFGYYTMSQTAAFYQRESEKLYETDPVTGEYVYDTNEVMYVESEIIDELLAYYDDQIDYSDYDANGDGVIDGIYLIYNHPTDDQADLWWAYQYYYYNTSTYDGMVADYLVWASNEFIDEGNEGVNARTYIHETGHMMGLDDYYDYYTEDTVNEGGLGAYMMDYNEGDHDPLSKILLGWVNPIVVEASSEVTILPHMENGDVILLIDEWQGTIFDEYLLITYYVPEDLNASNLNVMFTESGINIFHVSAHIGNGYLDDSYYYSIFNYNNTDTAYKLIDIVEADMNESIEANAWVEDSDLFQVGDILNNGIYNNYRWYNNTPLGYTVLIESIDDISATLIFTKE